MKKILLIVAAVLLCGALVYVLLPDGSTTSGSDTSSGKGEAMDDTDDGKTDEMDQTPKPKPGTVEDHDLPGRPSVSTTEEAQTVIDGQKPQLGLGEDDELDIQGNTSDEYGNEYYQIQQSYKGVPVFGARSVLEIEDGKAVTLSGSTTADIDLDINPTYQAEEAVAMGLKALGGTAQIKIKLLSEGKLIVYISTVGPHLAWLCDVAFESPAGPPEVMIVDAHNPVIISRQPMMID